MAPTATFFLIAFLATAALSSANPNSVLSVSYETQRNGHGTTAGLAVRRWHPDNDELGEQIAFIPGKWNAYGSNKCAYDAKNEILYIFTHEDNEFGSKTAEITGVSVNLVVNTVVNRLPPAPGCTAHNYINFDSISGEIVHTCIADRDVSINNVDTKTGAATTLRTVPLPVVADPPFEFRLPGYDEENQTIALSYSDGFSVGVVRILLQRNRVMRM
tara:strand:+ start:1290 stop:1937 length:648 start_codon:yes stop_codon:yes gene_type:complete